MCAIEEIVRDAIAPMAQVDVQTAARKALPHMTVKSLVSSSQWIYMCRRHPSQTADSHRKSGLQSLQMESMPSMRSPVLPPQLREPLKGSQKVWLLKQARLPPLHYQTVIVKTIPRAIERQSRQKKTAQ